MRPLAFAGLGRSYSILGIGWCLSALAALKTVAISIVPANVDPLRVNRTGNKEGSLEVSRLCEHINSQVGTL